MINSDVRGSRSRGEARIAAICAGGLFLFLSAVALVVGFGVMGALGACAALVLWWIAAGLQRRLPP